MPFLSPELRPAVGPGLYEADRDAVPIDKVVFLNTDDGSLDRPIKILFESAEHTFQDSSLNPVMPE